jgi:hypothetical protein
MPYRHFSLSNFLENAKSLNVHFNPIAQLFAAFSINRLPFVQMTVSEVESNLCPYFRVGECRSYIYHRSWYRYRFFCYVVLFTSLAFCKVIRRASKEFPVFSHRMRNIGTFSVLSLVQIIAPSLSCFFITVSYCFSQCCGSVSASIRISFGSRIRLRVRVKSWICLRITVNRQIRIRTEFKIYDL